MSDDKKPSSLRRIVNASEAVVVPTLSTLLSDALSILGSELAFYRAKTKRGQALDLKEARAVRDHIDSLCKLTKEAREQSRSEDLSKLSNEELMELAEKILVTNKVSETNTGEL